MGSEENDRDAQKGPQGHAEGQHGDKTHSRTVDQLNEGRLGQSDADGGQFDRQQDANTGRRRLVEDREQHDEAEKNSELGKRERE